LLQYSEISDKNIFILWRKKFLWSIMNHLEAIKPLKGKVYKMTQDEITLTDALKVIEEQNEKIDNLILLLKEREKQLDQFKHLVDLYSKSFSFGYER
jgi:hypothetical protein